MEHIKQYIWELLEDLGIDLENDNDASERTDKALLDIQNYIKKATKDGTQKIL